jgi:nucleoside phosphorylase
MEVKKIPQIILLGSVGGWTDSRNPFYTDLVAVMCISQKELHAKRIVELISGTPTVLIGTCEVLNDLFDVLPHMLSDSVPLGVVGLISTGDRIAASSRYMRALLAKVEVATVRSVYYYSAHINSIPNIQDIRSLVQEVVKAESAFLPT